MTYLFKLLIAILMPLTLFGATQTNSFLEEVKTEVEQMFPLEEIVGSLESFIPSDEVLQEQQERAHLKEEGEKKVVEIGNNSKNKDEAVGVLTDNYLNIISLTTAYVDMNQLLETLTADQESLISFCINWRIQVQGQIELSSFHKTGIWTTIHNEDLATYLQAIDKVEMWGINFLHQQTGTVEELQAFIRHELQKLDQEVDKKYPKI